MFGWRKRDQGFEWHKYVRTTIKLRRQARREKAEHIRQQAVEGIKAAGAAAGGGVMAASAAAADGLKAAQSAAVEGARVAGAAAGVAARRGAERIGAGSRVAAMRLGRGLGSLSRRISNALEAGGRRMIAAAQPLLAALARPVVQRAAWIGGGVLAAGGLLRAVILNSFDGEAALAAGVGAFGLLAALLPRLFLDGSPPLPGAINRWPAIRGAIALCVLVLGTASLWLGLGGSATGRLATFPRLSLGAPKEVVEGRVMAIVGDELRIGGHRIRLADVEFPDRDQTCVRAGGRKWRCGETASLMLARMTHGRRLACEVDMRDAQGKAIAICRDGAMVINAELIRSGHAFAASGLTSRYAAVEAEAKARRAGVWSGEAQRPADWRRMKWQEAQRRAPDGCPIKGQVAGHARTYVLPWSPEYDRVQVNPRRGGRWFCTEEEAISAGWRIAGR